MIAINKAEKDAINRRFPDVHIVRTMKQKSNRHRYYCEENRGVMRYLERLRADAGNAAGKEGVAYPDRKKRK